MFITNYNTYTGDSSERWCMSVNFPFPFLAIFFPKQRACSQAIVISIGGIFLKNALYVAWHPKKLWAFSDLVAAISAALHETFVLSKYVNSVSQFLLYWMRIICCIYKDFVRQLKMFLPSFHHLCACEMSPGWGHFWMDPSVGHLNGILSNARGVAGRGGGGWVCWSFDLTGKVKVV